PRDLLNVAVTVYRPEGEPVETMLTQVGPGVYEGAAPAGGSGAYVALARPRTGGGGADVALARPRTGGGGGAPGAARARAVGGAGRRLRWRARGRAGAGRMLRWRARGPAGAGGRPGRRWRRRWRGRQRGWGWSSARSVPTSRCWSRSRWRRGGG